MKKWLTKDYGLPALAALFLIIYPWITIKCKIGISASEEALFDSRVNGLLDLFLKGKSVLVVIFALIFLVILAYVAYEKKNRKLKTSKKKKGSSKAAVASENTSRFTMSMKKERLLIPAAVFIVLNILSLLMSEYKDVAFRGNSNSLEGFLQVLSYCVIFVAALVAFAKEDNLVYLKISAIALGVISIILTLIEVLYEPLSKIIIGDSWSSEYVNMTVLTFYNTTYFAAFLAMLIPIVFAIFLFETSMKLSLISGFVFIGLFIVNITTRSTMSLYVVIASSVVLLVIKLIQLLKKPKTETPTRKGLISLVVPVCFVVLLFAINAVSNNALLYRASSAGNNETAAIHKDNYYKLCDIQNEDGVIVFTGEDSSFSVSVDENGSIKFESPEGMEMRMEDNIIKFDGEFDAVTAWFEGGYLAVDLGYQNPIYFGITDDGIVAVSPDGRPIEDMSGNGLELDNLYSIATGRGFYWVNSLPIIKECIITGHGLGTFGLYFNQTDIVGSLNTHGTIYTLVDHPHNMYIQVAVQTGVISLIALLAIYVISLICGVRKTKVIELISNKGLLVGVFVAVLSFMVCSLTTDSMLTTTPIFCVLLGTLTGLEVEKKLTVSNR